MDDVQERKEVDDKELITLVKANPFLYNKAEKLYSNSEVKRLSWATIGDYLSKKMTGIFARFIYVKPLEMDRKLSIKLILFISRMRSLYYMCIGTEAEHRFLQLQQRFGKERKKVLQSQSRSGAGANHPTYTPKWDLYYELILFLADVIKHRK